MSWSVGVGKGHYFRNADFSSGSWFLDQLPKLSLTSEKLLACNNKDDVVALLQAQGGGTALSMPGFSSSDFTFNKLDGVGISIRAGASNNNTPLFKFTGCKIPRHIEFSFQVNTTYMIACYLRAVCPSTDYYNLFNIIDSHYYNSGHSGEMVYMLTMIRSAYTIGVEILLRTYPTILS